MTTWVPQVIDYSWKYPWRAFAAVLVAVLLMDLMFWKRIVGGAELDLGSGGGDGDCGGD